MSSFDPRDFLPYLLNRAAEKSSAAFQEIYKSKYGMLRTEWRVLFHLGHYGSMTARDICERGDLHKTKVSRAVAALETKRFLSRERSEEDHRFEKLALTKKGRLAFDDLAEHAEAFNAQLLQPFSPEEADALVTALKRLYKDVDVA